jgi:multicomponent Na+:H+ antiporter subunit B
MIDIVINVTLLAFLAITAVAILRLTNLFAIVMLFGIFSLLSAGLFVVMDAPDVAFTEAAVGAGISTVLMLATLALVKRPTKPLYAEAPRTHRAWLPLIVVMITGSALVYGTWDIPGFGAPEAPAQTHVARYYIDNALRETGVPNVVTAVLASYRGFDTLGEVVVVYTAGVAVLLLISRRRSKTADKPKDELSKMIPNLILHVIAKFVIPLIILFAFYVQFHGDFGPGGGFQAGVIFSAALILYALVFGLDTAEKIIPASWLHKLAALGVVIYAGVGMVSLLLKGNYLDYTLLGSNRVAGQHLGILLVELGVGITVASVMLIIFFAFAGRGRE